MTPTLPHHPQLLSIPSSPSENKKFELLHNQDFMRSVKIKCLENNWIYRINIVSIHLLVLCSWERDEK